MVYNTMDMILVILVFKPTEQKRKTQKDTKMRKGKKTNKK